MAELIVSDNCGKAKDLTGEKFGRWVVTGVAGYKLAGRRKSKTYYWNCLCECGVSRVVFGGSLIGGKSLSCGCLSREATSKAKGTHRMSGTSIHIIWKGMRQRCNNPANPNYHRYGGRGIRVCERWDSFENFYEDMGDRPSEKHSIDRISNDGNYEKSNCRWATKEQQARNTSGNRLITFRGKTQCLMAWSEELGMNLLTMQRRLSKLSVEEAFTKPIGNTGSKEIEIMFRGTTMPLSDWAEAIGVNPAGLRKRLKGWPLARALTEQPFSVRSENAEPTTEIEECT